MKAMIKSIVAALAVVVGLNAWAANAKLTVHATPSEGGTAKAALSNTDAGWAVRGDNATGISSKNSDVTIYSKAFPNDGYVFKYWAATADGQSVSTANPYAGTYKTAGTTTGTANYDLYAVFAAKEQPVDLSKDVSVELTVDGSDASALDYNGAERTVTVTVKYGGTPLTVGTDYTVSGDVTATGSAYEDKTYTVTIKGNGTKYLNSTSKQWTIKAPTGSFDAAALSTTAAGCALQDATTVAVTDGTKLDYVAENTWELSAVLKWPVTLAKTSTTQDDTDVKYIDEAHAIVEAAQGMTAFQTGNKQYKWGSTVYGDHTYIDTMTWKVQVTLAEVKAAADKGDTEMTFTLKAGAMAWTHSADGLKMTTYKMVLPLTGLQLNDNDSNIVYPTPHKHVWSQGELTDGKIVWTCQTTEPACTFDAPYVTFDAASKVYNGEAVAFKTTKSDNLATLLPNVTVGEVKYFKGETEIAAPKYTGSYVAKVAVGEKTVEVPFAITKPTDGYTDGWEVNCDTDTVRYDTWAEALAAATDGDTIIYYHTEEALNPKDTRVLDLSTDKTLTLDLGGETIKQTASFTGSTADNAIGLTIKNGGTGTLTLVNGRIQQPRYGDAPFVVSTQIAVEGNIVFGKDIKTVSQASNSDRNLKFYVKSGTLEVTDGQYQSGFVTDGGSVVISGGKFWSNDKPSTDMLAENYQIRTIEDDYIYEVFGHTHSFKYVASGNVITLVCEGDDADDCPYTITPQKLVLTANDAKYTTSAYDGASYVKSNDFVVSGAEIGDIEFYQDETKLGEAPTEVGGYTAKISVTFGSETFTAFQAFTIGHDHLWEYTAEGDTITMSCTNTCPAAIVHTAVLKVEDKTYTGAKQTPATVEKGEGFVGEVEVSYSADPINVGDYTAYAKIGDATASKAFKITAADIADVEAAMESAEFDYTAADIVNTIKSALAEADYDLTGITKAKGSGYSNETYKVTLKGKGNYKGTKTIEWTIKAPTGSFGEDAFTTTSKLVFSQEQQAWVTTSKLDWPASTLTKFSKPEHAILTADAGKTVINNEKISLGSFSLGEYDSVDYIDWTVGCTPAELDAADGEDVVHTMTACGLAWWHKITTNTGYGDKEGIKATDFDVTIATKDLVLQLPASATYDLGATVLKNVKIEIGAGAKVTSSKQQANIETTQTGYLVKETFENSVYTYENELVPVVVTVPALERANVTVKVGDKTIDPTGENEYTVSYGDTVVVTYTANEKGWQPATQTFTLENVTTAQTVSGMETLVYVHDHLFKYEKNGATLTATCTNEETTCAVENRKVALTLSVEDKTFDDTAVSATLENETAFTNATKATVGLVTYLDEDGAKIDAPKNAGTYKAQVVVTPGTADGIVLEKEFTISAKTVSNVTVTLDKVSVLETGSEITAQIVSVSDGTTTYTTADYDVSGELTGKDRGEYNVTLTFKGNYSGTAYGSWEIVEPTGTSTELTSSITGGSDYGELEDQTLTINDSTKLIYDAQKKKWFASLTIAWPRKVTKLDAELLGLITTKVQYTDVAHAWVKIGGIKYSGTQIKNGEAEGVSLETAEDKYWAAKSSIPWFEQKSYTFVTSVTWTVEISTNELEKALEKINPPKMPKMALLGAANATATPTLDKNGFLNYKATFGAYAWGDETEGDVDGLEDTKFTIRLKPEETTLFDENQIQVWPHHDHDWEYVIADGKCTATCKNDGCPVKTIAVELQGERTKTFDGKPLKLTVSNAVDFALHTGCEVSGAQYYQGTQELDEDPQVVGIYYAVFFVNGQEIKVEIEITTADIANAIAKLKEAFDFNFDEQVNELGTVKVGDLELKAGVDYTVEATSELTGTGSAREDKTYTVKLTGKGNYTGTKELKWTVKAPSGSFKKVEKAENSGGALDGSTLTMASGDNYGWKYYTAEAAPDKSGVAGFYAGITATYPSALTLAEGIQFTDLAHAFFTVGGQRYMGNETIPGVSCETVKKSFSDLFSSLSIAKSASEDTSYMKTFTWWQRLDLADLRAAVKAEASFVTNGISAGALVWKAKFGTIEYGDNDGIRETDFTILTKMDDLYLYDNDKNMVWPEHDHQWKWTVAGNALTAACDIAGCQYKKNPLVLTIAPEVAEKYCDTKPVAAALTGTDALVEATEATVGAVEYWQGETKLAGAPAEPGDYAAKCTVVSKDLASTNTIEAAFKILTGQAIWNGVHVADAAEYLEKKTQDSMDILVGKDFTASKTFVVPASWKAETLTEVDMTIKQFIAAVKAGKFGDLYTWDDVLDLIGGRVTAQELFKRLEDTTKKYTLLDCGAKTFDLNGFTVTAAEGVPFLRNEGMLTLLGEGTMTTNGFETLLVNVGTLSIEGGKYVGNLENTGALVVSGGYFTGTIANADDGTVVLTGGAYEIKPDEDFIPAGYDLVKRDGIYYVEKHEHKYTFLPLGKCLVSCTCWNWFVDDPDQIIQFSNCGAHKLGVFIGTRDNLTGILPKKEFATGAKPEANIVGYNYSALLKIGLLKNIKELVAIAEEAIEAEENWDEMSALKRIETMMSIVTSIKDLDIDVSDLVWDKARIEEETGLKFGEIKYYDAKTDEELAGAPIAAGTYRACVVITTSKGNDVMRSWKYSIGVDYKTDLEDWAEETKEELEKAWNDFRNKFDNLPTDEEVKDFFEGLRIENLTNEYADVDQKIIEAHNKMVEDLKNAHEKVKTWSKDAVDEVKDFYNKHNGENLDTAKDAIEKAWSNFCDKVENDWNRLPNEGEVKDFFEGIGDGIKEKFAELEAAGKLVDEKIIAAHDDMVKELEIVHTSIVKWTDETVDKIGDLFVKDAKEEEAVSEPEMPMLMMASSAAVEESYAEFSEEVEAETGRRPLSEDVTAFFETLETKLANLKAKHAGIDQKIVDAHDKMVDTIKSKHAAIVLLAENVANELKDLYERHEDAYLDDAKAAIVKAWDDKNYFEGSWSKADVEELFANIDADVRAWFEKRKQNHEPVDGAIIKAHDKMVNELKEAHAEMVAWLKGRFEQVSESELKAMPEEESEEAPAMLTLSVADESKAYDGTGVKFVLEGKSYFEKISGCTVEGPYYRPFGETGPVTDVAPTAPGHYEIFYKIFKDGKAIEFVVKHVFHIEKLLADHVAVYFETGTNFVYSAEEQGPKIWGVYCGLVELKDGDYTITGTTNATEVGEYAFTVKGNGAYEMYEETFNWSIVAPTRTFDEDAFRVRSELEYNAETKTWDTVATLDWPYDLRQIFRAPRYYTVDYAAADVTAGSVEPVLREFYRIKTGQMEQYVKADVWTIPFTPEQLTYAWTNGFTAITNTLTAYAIASENEPAGMAPTNFEYVVNLEGLKLYDDKGRQCYPIHNHEWTIENLEDGMLVANCNCKGCPVGHVEISIDAESKDWNGYPVWAEIVDEDDQFAIHTYAEVGDIVYANEAGEDLRCMPTEPGTYSAYAPVVIGGNRYKVWKQYEIRAVDISDATVYTVPDCTEFVFSGLDYKLNVNAVVAGFRLLAEGVDYTVGGTTNATAVGDYQIVIEGTGHYTGTRMIDWAIVAPTREFAEDAFNQLTFDVPGPLARKPYGEIEGKVLTVTASTNLWYDVATSNWYAGITVDWPYDLNQLCHAPQYTAPEKAYVKVSAATNVWSALDIVNGEAKDQNLAADVGEFYRIRHGRNESFVKRIGWDVEITIADILAARANGETNITYTMTLASPANREDPEGLAKTTYSVVLPLEGLKLIDEKGNQVYPLDVGEIVVVYDTDYTNFVWTGKEQGPTVTAAYWRGNLLTRDVDYTVSDDVGTDVGNYLAKITGTESCSGAGDLRAWSIIPAIDKFADDAFAEVEGERGAYGTLAGDVLTVTAATNLHYDVATSNWYAGVSVAWPSQLDKTLKNPQYVLPADAKVEITTPFTNATFTGSQILAGEADELGLALGTEGIGGANYVTDSTWDIEIKLDDVVDARALGLTEFTYEIKVDAAASATNPKAFSKTYTVVLPLDGIVLEDDEGNLTRVLVVALGKNAGMGGDDKVVAVTGRLLPSIEVPVREGYRFDGYWTTIYNGGVMYYDATGNPAREWNLTTTNLWAKWVPLFTVTLEKNLGVGGDDTMTVAVGDTLPSIQVPKRTGYAFDGYWASVYTGGVKYYNADGSGARVWDKAADTTLWAKWISDSKLELGLNGGTSRCTTLYASYGRKDLSSGFIAPTREGYRFDGYWTTVHDGGEIVIDKSGSLLKEWDKQGNVQLWAKWISDYKIELDPNGGKSRCTALYASYGRKDLSSGFTAPTREGYRFDGYWTTVYNDGMKIIDEHGALVKAWDRKSGIKLFAKWVSDSKLELGLNGGTSCCTTLYASYGRPDLSCALVVPTRPGYQFGGYWTTIYNGGVKVIDENGALVKAWDKQSGVQLWAKWVSDSKLEFGLNGGTSCCTTLYASYGRTDLSCALVVPTRPGYQFGGYWTTIYNGGVKVIDENGALVKAWDKHGDVKLWAKWIGSAQGIKSACKFLPALPECAEFSFVDGVYSGETTGENGMFSLLLEKVDTGAFDAYLYINGETYDAEATAVGETLTIVTEDDVTYVMTKVGGVWTLARK